MPYFAYKGRNPGGGLVEGVLESADSGTVVDQLNLLGIIPVEINLTQATHAGEEKESIFGHRVRDIDVMLFSRQMHSLLKAGVPIMRALAGIRESCSNLAFVKVLRRLRESLDSGHELSTAMHRQEKVFSPFYVSMVRVGEQTGLMDEIFLRLFHHMEFERFMSDQVKAALRYPIFVVSIMGIALVVINLWVIPAFAKVYESFKTELPVITKMMIGFSKFMVNYFWLVALLVTLMVIAFILYTKAGEGKYKWDRFKLGIPIAGKIIRKATLARFARGFALAIRSGITAVQGLVLTSQVVDNDYIGRHLEKMRQGVERGESILRVAMASGVFTPIVLQMIAVGEESGSLDEMMQEVADMYQREVEYELKTLSVQLEPILIIGLGILVLLLALGVFLPIWDLGKVAFSKG